MGSFWPKNIMFQLEISEELCVVTRKSDTKFKGKLIRGLKNYIKNLVNFHGGSLKICTLMGFFYPKHIKIQMKKYRRGMYDGPEGPLFFSMVFSEVFPESDIVLRSVKQFQGIFRQFSEVSNSSRKFKQFLELSNSSWKSQTVLGSLKQFSELFKQFLEVSKGFQKFETNLGTLKQFSEVSKISWKVQKVLGNLKKFSRPQVILGNRSQKFQIVLGNLKLFLAVSMSCLGSKKILGILKKLSVLPESVCTAITRSVGKIGTLQQNPRIKPLKEFNLLLRLKKTRPAAFLKLNSFVEKFLVLY